MLAACVCLFFLQQYLSPDHAKAMSGNNSQGPVYKVYVSGTETECEAVARLLAQHCSHTLAICNCSKAAACLLQQRRHASAPTAVYIALKDGQASHACYLC